MHFRVPLVLGTLKIKQQRHLLPHEHDRRVPVWQWGSHYLVWQRNGYEQSLKKPRPIEERPLE